MHLLHTVTAVLSDFVRVYRNLILVLLQIGHVPRLRDGRCHNERPLFGFATVCYPFSYLNLKLSSL